MANRALAAVLVLASATLAGCGRGADSGATANPNAPGSPGVGNSTAVARPQAPDGPPGGPSGVAGSAPHTGASGGDVIRGTTGSGGVSEQSGRSQTPQPGTGTTGGLGDTSKMGAAAAGQAAPNAEAAGVAPRGSPNTGSFGATGER